MESSVRIHLWASSGSSMDADLSNLGALLQNARRRVTDSRRRSPVIIVGRTTMKVAFG